MDDRSDIEDFELLALGEDNGRIDKLYFHAAVHNDDAKINEISKYFLTRKSKSLTLLRIGGELGPGHFTPAFQKLIQSPIIQKIAYEGRLKNLNKYFYEFSSNTKIRAREVSSPTKYY